RQTLRKGPHYNVGIPPGRKWNDNGDGPHRVYRHRLLRARRDRPRRRAAEKRDELATFIKKTIGHDTTHRALAMQSLNLSPFSFPRVDASAGGQFIRSPRRR